MLCKLQHACSPHGTSQMPVRAQAGDLEPLEPELRLLQTTFMMDHQQQQALFQALRKAWPDAISRQQVLARPVLAPDATGTQ